VNGYKAFFSGKETDVYAESLYAAKLKALDHFKPRKSQEHMVSVVLCEKDGKQVSLA
jgi:hypothetical protein